MLDPIKRKQYLLLSAIAITLSLVLYGLISLFLGRKTQVVEQAKIPKKSLTTGSSRMNPQEVWVHDFSIQFDLIQKRMEVMEQGLEKILKLNKPTVEGINAHQDPLKNDSADLRSDLQRAMKESSEFQSQIKQNILPPQPVHDSVAERLKSKVNNLNKKALQKITLNLHKPSVHKLLKTTDNTIPAGSFAEGILLGGVDASTSIQASSDPRPILLRLTHPGTLPRRFRSDLEGCHVLAASYGDISSERVFMRLEKLSCVERSTGEILELSVQGYVAGEDGRAGIRGALVDRAGPSMRHAMVGGFFSSFGKFLGQAKSPLLFSPSTGLAQTDPLSSTDILKQSAGNGMGGALDKYAEFYIKRAEQMQPIIQVAAGRKVDVVFTQGLDFSDSALRQILSKSHDQQRFQQLQTVEGPKPIQNTLSHEGVEP